LVRARKIKLFDAGSRPRFVRSLIYRSDKRDRKRGVTRPVPGEVLLLLRAIARNVVLFLVVVNGNRTWYLSHRREKANPRLIGAVR
jgi:hypothetical protein